MLASAHLQILLFSAALLLLAIAAEGAPQMPPQAPIPIAIVDAPSNLGLRPPKPDTEPGVKHLPDALRKTGIVKRLGARDAGRVNAAPYEPGPNAETGFRNGPAIARFSEDLAARLIPILDRKEFAFVLGGDCGILIGPALALKQRGRYGLAYIDGHDDFSYARDPKYRGRYAAGGLALSLATGHGPDALVDLKDGKPYIRAEDAVQIGLSREPADTEFADTQSFERSGIKTWPVDDIERRGGRAIGAEARAYLTNAPTQGFWIHIDADVLDAKIMPAVDSPNPRGLTFAQLKDILAVLLASPKAVGLELTIFDPNLDPDGTLARQLADTIEQAFAESGRFKTAEN
jgi:arginase